MVEKTTELLFRILRREDDLNLADGEPTDLTDLGLSF